MKSTKATVLKALKVHQWLADWDRFKYDAESLRSKPPKHFYLAAVKASDLRALSGVHRRQRDQPGFDPGVQRGHQESRSEEIARFIRNGFPYSGLSKANRESNKFEHFRQPGWLATSIVVNILNPKDSRRAKSVAKADLITVADDDETSATITLPSDFYGASWKPAQLHPIEIIDGQHRLFAFSEETDFELPVVAFHGLDIGWQAYLFWTINIKPKKINQSLAFDLYPLLRTQEWLDQGDDFGIYRETRAQEMVEALWSFPASPWYRKINMLGDRGRAYVSQASWIRSLTSAIIKRSEGKGVTIGGLFSGETAEEPLEWNRQQQAAFLIYFWQQLLEAVKAADFPWTEFLREEDEIGDEDSAFYGSHSLINQDQGVRVLLHVLNDICVLARDDHNFDAWLPDDSQGEELDLKIVGAMLKQISKRKFATLIRQLCTELAKFDWRSSNAPGLSPSEELKRKTYRGSSGYRELRFEVLGHLQRSGAFKSLARAALKGMRGSSA